MPTTVIRNADWVIAWDEATSRHVYRRGVDLVFTGDRIAYLGKAYAGMADKIIDGAGLMVMPGLIDIHSHPHHEPLYRGIREEHGVANMHMTGLYERGQAFSAPDDEARDELVPVNRRWKVAEVLDAAWDYAAVTGRRVSIEYALIRDVNDQPWRADLLGSLLAGHLVHVNLIPLNPTPGSKWTASRPGVQEEFVRRIAAHGVAVTVRDTRGREIDGACGQLAASTAPGRAVGPARRASAPIGLAPADSATLPLA